MRIHHLWRAVLLALIVLTVISTALVAQDERESVLKTVQRFFDAMASRDTVMAQEAMLVDGTSFSTTQTPDGPRVSGFSHREYLDGLATGTDQWFEQMWDAEVRVRGTIATVWTPYEFRINGGLSHCGVDAFSLVKTQTGWRIASVVYTVEAECE